MPPATSGFKLRTQVKCKVLGIRKQLLVQQRIELIGVTDLFNFSVFEKQSTLSRHQRGVCLDWGRETSLAELRIQFYWQWKLFQVPLKQIVWLTSKRDKQPLNVVYSKLGCNKLRNFQNHRRLYWNSGDVAAMNVAGRVGPFISDTIIKSSNL